MSSNATIGVETRTGERKGERRDASADGAIPDLPIHLVVAHILRSEYFDDPADLARLPAVSRAMRDAVAATELEFEELDEDDAVDLGCLSTVHRMQRGGRLSRQELLCEAAARSGQLEELKILCAKRHTVGRIYVSYSSGGRAPRGDAVVMREWLPVGRADVRGGGIWRAPRGAAVATHERLSVG